MSIATEITRLQTAKADIKTAIENKGVEVGDGTLDTYASKIAEISGGGGDVDAERKKIWDGIQQNGTRTDYQQAFRNWYADNWKPYYDIKPTSVAYMFYFFRKPDETGFTLSELCEEAGITIDFSECTNFGQCFSYSGFTDVGTIDATGTSSIASLFVQATKLTTAHFLLTENGTRFQGAFAYAGALTNLTIDGVVIGDVELQWSPLSKDSIISVVNALSETETGATVTFKKTAVNTAFGIDVDDEATYPEGSEFYNLINSKSSWTFSFA